MNLVQKKAKDQKKHKLHLLLAAKQHFILLEINDLEHIRMISEGS